MKKLLLVLTIIAGTTFSASAQALSQGSIVADVYYGFPNLYKTVLEAAYTDNGDDLSIGGYGPVGVRGEYLVSEKLGVGVDFMINNTNVKYSYMGYQTDANGNYVTDDNGALVEENYEDKIATSKWGAMVTLNYHFINNDKLDFYFIAGAGYKNRTWSYESTDPNFINDEVSTTVIPVAARIGLGTRIFFTENIGANIGVGFGQGGILTAGLSFKF
jgi:opacity protein-like surface antigen